MGSDRYVTHRIPVLQPGVDRYPASQQDVLRDALSRATGGQGVSSDALGTEIWGGHHDHTFMVKVEKDGGNAGSAASGTIAAVNCSFTYTVKDLADETTLGTEITPERPRYPGTTYLEAGSGGRSDYGVAAYDADGDLILLHCEGEIEDTDTC